MRVKKLSATRRHKPGDDDSAIGAAGDQEEPRWVSPTKPREDAASSSGSGSGSGSAAESSGASSPSDPYSVHPVELQTDAGASSASPARFQLDPRELFDVTGNGGSRMAKSMAPQVAVGQQDAPRSAGVDVGKPRSWHDVVDNAVREAMHAKIVEILRALKPNAPDKVLERVPGLAYRMEESLFRSAQSEGEYRDFATLPQRLAQIQEASAKRLLQQQSAPAPAARAVQASPRAVLTEDQARVVFQCLQTWRQKLVNMYGVAPWEILPNQALAKVALHLPSSEQELAVCGVDDALLARFGSSLLQELRQICDVWTNASAKYSASPSTAGRGGQAAKAATRKAEGAKRPATDASGANKRRKAAAVAGDASPFSSSARLAPAPALSFSSSASSSASPPLMASSQLLFRAPGIDSLPTLLPSASVASAANGKKLFGANAGRLSPPGQVIHPPLFSRIESGRQEHSHMHLLAQGAGQVSKQQLEQQQQQQQQPQHAEQPSADAYEKEIQTLRWMLHQSQQEKSQLEAEVQHLRQQLSGAPHPSH